ncbi:hypothetical protein Lfu02_77920 [Longispora fulva]|nr:hypothetical protein Lfu02_77920 [Longispora fulva]
MLEYAAEHQLNAQGTEAVSEVLHAALSEPEGLHVGAATMLMALSACASDEAMFRGNDLLDATRPAERRAMRVMPSSCLP